MATILITYVSSLLLSLVKPSIYPIELPPLDPLQFLPYYTNNAKHPLQGCDNAACWCNKGNLDLRIATITRCASTSCTFANMNTVTDVSILSGIQVQYCVDQNHSPSGMTVPSEAESATTESGVQSTGVVPVGTGTGTGTDMASRTRVTSGPSATGELGLPFALGTVDVYLDVDLFLLNKCLSDETITSVPTH